MTRSAFEGTVEPPKGKQPRPLGRPKMTPAADQAEEADQGEEPKRKPRRLKDG